jgi:hypothetical protein
MEANRARHDNAEVKRRKQEERTRLAGVLSACGWDKETADPADPNCFAQRKAFG